MTGSGAAGLYLHVPFCSAVCPYCDFAVTVGGERSRSAYLDALSAEIASWGAEPGPFEGSRFGTVYLGGGTPSALDASALERVLAELVRALPGTAGAYRSIEANPEDASPAALAAWRGLGFGTVSLGVQSFDAGSLAFLGRRHGPGEARAAVEAALAAGFATVSVDLIYGLPGQTAASWRRDLETVVALGPQHVSCYQLEVHPGTPFGHRRARGELAEAPEPRQAELFALTHERLAAGGYHAYEVSNFAAAPEHRSRHNRKYWDGSAYLGLGPSAHSFDGERTRWWNERRLGPWRGRIERGERPIAGHEELTPGQRVLEALMLGLRTTDGVDLDELARRWGIDVAAANRNRIERLAADGLVTFQTGRLAPTLAGLAVADGLAVHLDVPEAAPRRSKADDERPD